MSSSGKRCITKNSTFSFETLSGTKGVTFRFSEIPLGKGPFPQHFSASLPGGCWTWQGAYYKGERNWRLKGRLLIAFACALPPVGNTPSHPQASFETLLRHCFLQTALLDHSGWIRCLPGSSFPVSFSSLLTGLPCSGLFLFLSKGFRVVVLVGPFALECSSQSPQLFGLQLWALTSLWGCCWPPVLTEILLKPSIFLPSEWHSLNCHFHVFVCLQLECELCGAETLAVTAVCPAPRPRRAA